MAVNQNHTQSRSGVVVPFGESVLQQCQEVYLSFPQQPEGSNLFSGTKRGTLFLTSYRVIFVTLPSVNDPMLSFMMPFDLISNWTLEQPVFAANYIKGTIQAAPDGGWEGQATFKLSFRKGGAVQFAQLMMKAASAAASGVPLGSVTCWFGAPGLSVVTCQGSMMGTQQMPGPAYPVVVYGPPPAGYGTPPVGYGAPPPGYGVLPAGYGAPPVGYRAPPAGHGAPPAGHGVLLAGNEAPPARCETPPAGNRARAHESVAAQLAGSETSPSVASSSQAHLPPSKK
ncbi:postacrosomal sheath WW domain-binding protein [Equus asinus]|uniref:postacrosomal sheath WW domain-binding protein n=1 Tax=Equus asinus TaxID=9793 RepID=UPI00071A73AC